MLRLIGVSVLFLFGIFIFDQVIVPLWKNLPIFPVFNKTKKELESTVIKNNDLIHNKEITEKIIEQEKIFKKTKKRSKK